MVCCLEAPMRALKHCLNGSDKVDLSGFDSLQGNEHIYYIDVRTPFHINVQGRQPLNYDAGHGAALVRIETPNQEAIAIVVDDISKKRKLMKFPGTVPIQHSRQTKRTHGEAHSSRHVLLPL